MKEIQYKTFSRITHQKNSGINKTNVCQFELTFRCGLHCRHCYTDCYNKSAYFKKELNTSQVKLILDNIHKAGIIWLGLTGGDPLTRSDFLEIYSYAKEKGFIITVFTNGYSMNDKIIRCLNEKPPFVIEITLNAVTKDIYEEITQVEGSFVKAMRAIRLILKNRLPLKIKTQVIKDNLGQLTKIEAYVRGLGLQFRPSYILYPRLDGNLAPCNLRISPYEALTLDGGKRPKIKDCDLYIDKDKRHYLFHCVAGGGDGFFVDPYGNMSLCSLIRNPRYNLLKADIECAVNRLSPRFREEKFRTASKCRDCDLRKICCWCPGRAYLEKGDLEEPIEYYCALAGLTKSIEKK